MNVLVEYVASELPKYPFLAVGIGVLLADITYLVARLAYGG